MTDPVSKLRAMSMELTAISEIGLTYSTDHFDIGRFHRVGELAHELMDFIADHPAPPYDRTIAAGQGYTTPKLDVRGGVFNDDGEILLVRERIDHDRWTLPGGWCDILEGPSKAIEREVLEEAGLECKAYHLALLADRDQWPHEPALDHHVYKLFFLCKPLGELDESFTSDETSAVGWFDVDDLPELSVGRVLPEQLRVLHEQWRNPGPAHFD